MNCRWRALAFFGILLAATALAQEQIQGDVHVLKEATAGKVEFGLITSKGYVTFRAGGEWTVLKMGSKPPLTTMLFQIPNPADDGTPDSTNLVIMTFESGDAEADAGLNRVLKKGADAVESGYGPWKTFTEKMRLEKTSYVARSATRALPGVTAYVLLSWPQLAANPANYDATMEAAFRAVLDSASGGLGPKPTREGEVMRRPTN